MDNVEVFREGFQRQTPEEMTNRMADQLKLDDKQKSKVLDLNKEYEGVLGGPGMGRGFGRGQGGPGGQGGFQGGQQGQRPQLTEEQRAEMQKQMQQRMEKRQEYEKKLKEILTDASRTWRLWWPWRSSRSASQYVRNIFQDNNKTKGNPYFYVISFVF